MANLAQVAPTSGNAEGNRVAARLDPHWDGDRRVDAGDFFTTGSRGETRGKGGWEA